MNQTQVRWGVLGAARIARTHVIPALQRGAHSRVDALASRDRDQARRAASESGIPKAYGSYAELLADPDLDAVYIPLPNDLHAPWTLQALAAGKHVLCEKPVAMNAAQLREVEGAARARGLQVAEAFMIRFHPQWHRVRALVNEGRLGSVRAIQSFFAYDNPPGNNLRNSRTHGGGGLYDIGGYSIVAGRWVFGSDPQRAIALVQRDDAGGGADGVDRLVSALVAFPNGGQLSFIAATNLARTQRVVIHGSRGRLEMQTPFNPTAERPTRLLIDDARDLYGGGVTVEEIPGVNQYALQCEAFSRAILERRAFEFDLRDAMVNMLTIDALFRSETSLAWERV